MYWCTHARLNRLAAVLFPLKETRVIRYVFSSQDHRFPISYIQYEKILHTRDSPQPMSSASGITWRPLHVGVGLVESLSMGVIGRYVSIWFIGYRIHSSIYACMYMHIYIERDSNWRTVCKRLHLHKHTCIYYIRI